MKCLCCGIHLSLQALRYFGEHEGKPGSRAHNQDTNLEYFTRYHTCVEAINQVYDTADFKLAERFDVVRTDDGAGAVREIGSKAAREDQVRAAAMEPLRRHI